MKKILPDNLTAVILTGAILFLAPVFSIAQSRRIAVSPLSFEFTIERGGSDGDHVQVLNPSYEDDVTVDMRVEDMFPEGEEGRVILRSPEEDLEAMALSSWISFEPEEFSLEPRENKHVRFTIDVPENANPGGHYGGIVAGTGQSEIEGTGVGITQRIASLLLLTVSGEMEEDLSVVDFETSQNYYEYGPVEFNTRFKNEGTVHLRPDAEIIIEDLLGREVDRVSIEPRSVLPDAIRRIGTDWNQYNLWGLRYTARVTGIYGEEGQPLESEEVHFWAFPWKYGIAIFLLLIFFILTRKRWITIIKILVFGEKAFSSD